MKTKFYILIVVALLWVVALLNYGSSDALYYAGSDEG